MLRLAYARLRTHAYATYACVWLCVHVFTRVCVCACVKRFPLPVTSEMSDSSSVWNSQMAATPPTRYTALRTLYVLRAENNAPQLATKAFAPRQGHTRVIKTGTSTDKS